MGTFFQVKRVIKKIYGRRKLIANVWKKPSNKSFVILHINNAGINIRTVQNLLFYLEPHQQVFVKSGDASFWLKFLTYLAAFRNVSVFPFVSASKATHHLYIGSTPGMGKKMVTIKLVDQPTELSEINVPYYKHPGFCWPQNIKPQQVADKRKGWVFFAGNVNPGLYNNPKFEAKYNIPNRHTVYTYLQGDDRSVTNAYFDNTKEEDREEIFLHTLAANNLPREQYIHYLQQFNCMICAPGVTMPLCHNIIEAMEFGCIPIFSYPDWLPYGLVHEENCFIYSTIDELVVILDKLDNYKDSDFISMRKKLAAYYKKHFLDFSIDLDTVTDLVLLNENKQMLD